MPVRAYMKPLREVLGEAERRTATAGRFKIPDLVGFKAVMKPRRGRARFHRRSPAAALVGSLREKDGNPIFLNADTLDGADP